MKIKVLIMQIERNTSVILEIEVMGIYPNIQQRKATKTLSFICDFQ